MTEEQLDLMTEEQLDGYNAPPRTLTLLQRSTVLTRIEVNNAIATNFRTYANTLKIVVTPDRDITDADCVTTEFSETRNCL